MSLTRDDFKIGAPVHTDEGEVGRLKYIVVDPEAETVTHLIVERGCLLRRTIVVPTGWVEEADAQRIHLNAKLAELESLPEFREQAATRLAQWIRGVIGLEDGTTRPGEPDFQKGRTG